MFMNIGGGGRLSGCGPAPMACWQKN